MPTPEQLWQSLVEEAGEDAIAEAAAVTVPQAEQFLSAAGFDVKQERATATATIAKLTGDIAPRTEGHDGPSEATAWVSHPVPPARKAPASRRVVWLAAALAIAAATGGILYALGHRPKPPDRPVEPPRETPSAQPPAPPPTQEAPRIPFPLGPEKPTSSPRQH
jgi:uncharacterized iron-regulated membrane protein